MGRAALLIALALLLVSAAHAAAFEQRIVAVPADLSAEATRLHIEFCVGQGFNALWVPARAAGQWDRASAPDGPRLDARFLELARWCRKHGVAIYVELDPQRDSAGRFAFTRADDEARLRRFLRMLHRRARVRDFVLAFRSVELTDLRDVVALGRSSAPAQLQLAHRLRGHLRRKDRLWLAPAVASTRWLGDPELEYAATLLRGLPALDPSIGIVWNGPQPLSPTVTIDDFRDARALLGNRPILLRDRFPRGSRMDRLALAVSLAPLTGRDPGLREHLAGYVGLPAQDLGASRFALRTTAAFLREPEAYDPQRAWSETIAQLAGDDAVARDALKTQAMEWGGWIEERNYRNAATDNPLEAAGILENPAAVAGWGWVERRYAQRMEGIALAADAVFRENLLEVMARRLAIARVIPAVRELRARRDAGRRDVGELLRQIRAARERAAEHPTVRLALDRFLSAAGVSL